MEGQTSLDSFDKASPINESMQSIRDEMATTQKNFGQRSNEAIYTGGASLEFQPTSIKQYGYLSPDILSRKAFVDDYTPQDPKKAFKETYKVQVAANNWENYDS